MSRLYYINIHNLVLVLLLYMLLVLLLVPPSIELLLHLLHNLARLCFCSLVRKETSDDEGWLIKASSIKPTKPMLNTLRIVLGNVFHPKNGM